MEGIRSKIQDFDKTVTFKNLRDFIQHIDIESIDYNPYVNEPEAKGDYGRNILILDPFECVVINWPPGVSSAIHHHEGPFGFVWVLEGELDNIFYKENDNQLIEVSVDKYGRGGLIPEPDGIIHKLVNSSSNKRAISIHFYYPAIKNFDGMKIFNSELGYVGILGENAKTASWSDAPDHYKEFKKKAFEFISFEDLNKNKTHFICNIIPKPKVKRINEMNADYFCEQAEQYDISDFNQPDRKSYTQTIDELIAKDIKACNTTKKHIDIATGTGRRAINIRDLSGLDYEMVGVDISEEMCKIAESRGIKTYHQDWANEDSHSGEMFDSATFLYAFGHIASKKKRIKTLNKINSYLHSGGFLFIDLFSINNKNEWGPQALKDYESRNLSEFGYERGDVFYRKKGMKELAFLHYFDLDEINEIMYRTGFYIEWVKYVGYAKNAGDLVNSDMDGSYFIKAVKI